MDIRTARSLVIAAAFSTLALADLASAQQYNSDNYLSKPKGVATIILTAGERNTMWMTTFSLLDRWEFTAAAYIFNSDRDLLTDDGYSTSFYAKYMVYENKAKTGGVAVKAGTGLEPGYLDVNVGYKDAFQTWWTNAPVTVPLFDNKLSWDVMPGLSVTDNQVHNEDLATSFTYATRLGWYPVSPLWSIAGEIYGAEGQAVAIPEYRIGYRWEPNPHVVIAFTYDHELHGDKGAGFEVGLMVFTPPFFSIGK